MFFVCFEKGSHYVAECPGTHYVNQAGLELNEICLPLPRKC